jgi:hypothetical protein
LRVAAPAKHRHAGVPAGFTPGVVIPKADLLEVASESRAVIAAKVRYGVESGN